MPLLFSYGTLQDSTVQLATFGRVLEGERDAIVGFERSHVAIRDVAVITKTGRTHHDNARFTGNADHLVEGTAFEVAEAELNAADIYERQADYVRVRAPLASGRQTWVYVHVDSAPQAK